MTTANNANDIMSCYSNITDSVRDGYSDILNSFTGKTDGQVHWCNLDTGVTYIDSEKMQILLNYISQHICLL